MTTTHENAAGIYFATRHQVTRIYQVVEKRQLGSDSILYWVSTGSNVKYSTRSLEKAVAEATRRQRYIDSK